VGQLPGSLGRSEQPAPSAAIARIANNRRTNFIEHLQGVICRIAAVAALLSMMEVWPRNHIMLLRQNVMILGQSSVDEVAFRVFFGPGGKSK
jgi:hypothetical protein